MDNAARPSGALVFEPGDGVPGNLTEEQIVRLKEDMAAQFQGAVNAGRPLLLEGGLKWQQMAFSPSDMDFINTKHVAAREIALAFGVPPMLLGIPGDNTYANYQEANRAFWRLTLLPLVDRVLGSLGRWLDDEDGDLRLEADRDRITALAVERDALWTRLGSAAFMTTNEKRAEVGLDPVEGGDDLPSLQEVGNAFGPFELREKKRSAQLVERPDLEPVMVKIWRTQSDGTVRESHRAADGQIVLEDELFKVGDAELREPRDPDGPIEEVINCRCQVDYKLITELQGEERQRAQGVIRDRCQQLNVDLAILQLNIDDALRKIENTQDELKKKMESANFSAKKSIIDLMKVAAELMASLSTPKNVTILALRSSALGRLISLVEFMYSFDENVKEFIENDNEAKDAVKDINFHLDFIEKTQEKVRAKLELMERLDCATSVNR